MLTPLRYSQGINSSKLFVLRKYGGRILEEKDSASSVWPAIEHARLFDLDRPDARENRSLGQAAIADHLAVASFIAQLAMRLDPLGDFRFDRLSQHPLSAAREECPSTRPATSGLAKPIDLG